MGERFIMRKWLNLFLGVVISGFGIALVVNAGLGAFPITAGNFALSELLNIPYSVASVVVELIMIIVASIFKEKIGITTIVNGLFGGVAIDLCKLIIPSVNFLPLQILMLLLGTVVLSVGNYFLMKTGLGNSSSNSIQNVIQKVTGRSTGFARNTIEVVFLFVGMLGSQVGIATIILSLGYGTVMGLIFKVLKFNPLAVKQNYIKRKQTHYFELLIN